ncbi:general stress protein 26 [Maribacter spongiicola]|uniref:General stress protein 26 n=1 Tax=Maribacter spongiicola TaxID=1206753 RepID=A0A4R7K6D5_9FLAO|nr:pyridoxamine 5'-phosphate oxidase family protein [Maribacter spongiicola]TDT45249.1 general stress protein 26 [Maribacter spongiicola]
MATKHLFNKSAQDKIKELAEAIDFTMLATNLSKRPIHAIPMSTKKVDENGNIWFLSNKHSTHNANIHIDEEIHLFYAKAMSMEFMNVYGTAEILEDRSIISKFYQKSDDNWFNGENDPNITAIKVTPKDAHYWDTKNNMLISLFKMGIGAFTGEKPDLGEEGKLTI